MVGAQHFQKFSARLLARLLGALSMFFCAEGLGLQRCWDGGCPLGVR